MRSTAALLCILVACGGSQRDVRDSLVAAGDKRLAEGKGELALANYDRAIKLEPAAAAPVIEKRGRAALIIAERRRDEARKAMDGKQFEEAFRLLWNLDKSGAFGAPAGRDFFASDYERAAKGLWEQIEQQVAKGRHFVAMRDATRVAAAFPESHWTYLKLSVLQSELSRLYATRATEIEPYTVGKLFEMTALALRGDLDGSRALRDALQAQFGVVGNVKLTGGTACDPIIAELRSKLPDAKVGRTKVDLAVRLSCSEDSAQFSGTRTETYTETVPVEVERDELVREEWGTLGAQTTSCTGTDSRGRCTSSNTTASKGQTTYRLRKRKVKAIEYKEVERTRDVAYTGTTHTLTASGSFEMAVAIATGETDWTTIEQPSTQQVSAKSSTTSSIGKDEARNVGFKLYDNSKLAALIGTARRKLRESYLAIAREHADRDPHIAGLAYLAARVGGDTSGESKAYLDKHLGLDLPMIEQLLLGNLMFEALPVVALELPAGEQTETELDYADAIVTKQRRRAGAQLPGVDVGYRMRRSPLRDIGSTGSVGYMTSIELAARGRDQGGSLSIGARTFGGATAGFNLAWLARARRNNGSAVLFGASIGGEIRMEKNQHTGLNLLVGYMHPVGPASVQLQLDANLIQIFGDTGSAGEVMHLSPVQALVELPLGPLFVRAGGSYFIGGLEPLSIEATLGARLVLGD